MMQKGFLCCFLFLSCSLLAQVPVPAAGKIIRHESFSSKYVSARHVDVWLPEGYSSRKKYAVLYMHDGQMLFDSTNTWNRQEWGVDETMSALIEQKKIQPCIVVGVWNGGKQRHADYFPQKPLNYLTKEQIDSLYHSVRMNGEAVFQGETVHSDLYLRFLTEELKPFIDQTYSVFKDRSHTFVAGSSMGGLISLYALCEYPNIFGGAACLSTHWPGTFIADNNPVPQAFFSYLRDHLPPPKKHRLYFDLGTATLDSLYPALQKQVDVLLSAKGFSEKNWKTIVVEGADHSERSWKERLAIPFEWLLRRR